MSCCEKCWEDAYIRFLNNPFHSQSEHYHNLLKERENYPCNPEEQAGQFWNEEKQRDKRHIAKSEKGGEPRLMPTNR